MSALGFVLLLLLLFSWLGFVCLFVLVEGAFFVSGAKGNDITGKTILLLGQKT